MVYAQGMWSAPSGKGIRHQETTTYFNMVAVKKGTEGSAENLVSGESESHFDLFDWTNEDVNV